MSERIEAMRQFIEQFPDNPFPRYALAMELKSSGQLEEAAAALADLATRAPEYVATYLQWGMILEDLGQVEEARSSYTRGIEAAEAAGNAHALSELRAALDALD